MKRNETAQVGINWSTFIHDSCIVNECAFREGNHAIIVLVPFPIKVTVLATNLLSYGEILLFKAQIPFWKRLKGIVYWVAARLRYSPWKCPTLSRLFYRKRLHDFFLENMQCWHYFYLGSRTCLIRRNFVVFDFMGNYK